MASQVTFLASAAFIMDPLCIFVITTQNFFSVLLKGFSSFLPNLSGASSLYVRDEVFWTKDLIEETTKRLHDS